ncbi:peptidoglycan-binding protein [Patescibacteria group bacterium]|nr:peptidoglycan-binding protein [Patescibacteria group bacterium]
MNELKYQITQIVFLILLGIGAYWALTSLDSGVQYTREQIIEDEQQVSVPDEMVNAVNNETVLVVDESSEEEVEPVETTTSQPEEQPQVSTHQTLIDALQKMVDDNVTMDSGSSGTRVGTVQKFLDIYFTDKTISVDNDFGPTTKNLVKEFQQKELNGGDGRVGPNTLKAMIGYLEA